MNSLQKFITYLKEVREEAKKISWPTKNQSLNNTVIVILISAIVAIILGFFDFIFNNLITKIIIK